MKYMSLFTSIGISLGLAILISPAYSQKVMIIKADELYRIIESPSKKLQILNFWATWCKPCIEELPEFEQMNTEENVEVHLISLDPINILENRVKPFIRKKKLHSKLYLLDENDYDSIINRVDKHWSGAIPATIIKKPNEKRYSFYEKKFETGELYKTIQMILNK